MLDIFLCFIGSFEFLIKFEGVLLFFFFYFFVCCVCVCIYFILEYDINFVDVFEFEFL